MLTVLDKMLISLKTKRLTRKSHGDSQLVVALVLIAVAVGLCVIFQDQLKGILNDLLTTVNAKINTLVNATGGGGGGGG